MTLDDLEQTKRRGIGGGGRVSLSDIGRILNQPGPANVGAGASRRKAARTKTRSELPPLFQSNLPPRGGSGGRNQPVVASTPPTVDFGSLETGDTAGTVPTITTETVNTLPPDVIAPDTPVDRAAPGTIEKDLAASRVGLPQTTAFPLAQTNVPELAGNQAILTRSGDNQRDTFFLKTPSEGTAEISGQAGFIDRLRNRSGGAEGGGTVSSIDTSGGHQARLENIKRLDNTLEDQRLAALQNRANENISLDQSLGGFLNAAARRKFAKSQLTSEQKRRFDREAGLRSQQTELLKTIAAQKNNRAARAAEAAKPITLKSIRDDPTLGPTTVEQSAIFDPTTGQAQALSTQREQALQQAQAKFQREGDRTDLTTLAAELAPFGIDISEVTGKQRG